MTVTDPASPADRPAKLPPLSAAVPVLSIELKKWLSQTGEARRAPVLERER